MSALPSRWKRLGVELASNARAQRAALDAFLPAVAVLVLTTVTAGCYARLRGALTRAGTPIPENDLWIAALAVEHNWPLATPDANSARVAGLIVQDWR